jgi:hypothetical protein
MRTKKIVFALALSLLLVGCYKQNAVDLPLKIDNNTKETIEEKVEDSNDMKNIVCNKNEVSIIDNSKNIDNLELRNSTFVKEYYEAVNLIKGFSENNLLELIFAEPIEHRISRMKGVENRPKLLEDLQLAGAETVSYYTDEEILNVELSITEEDNSYSHITYKVSIANVDENFNFKESKLYEFRNMFIETNELDFDKLNNYVKDRLNNKIDVDAIFLNKIDDDRYEIIRIENNNCYYKLIYNPKL